MAFRILIGNFKVVNSLKNCFKLSCRHQSDIVHNRHIPVASNMDMEKCISHQYKQINKALKDGRSYIGLELSNKMKVLLISDPKADKSAAAINVQTGFMNDPKDIPGLAHFLEHMLFLGTEKYPIENEYQKFLQAHNGTCNAYTADDHTCYHFDVSTDFLKEALDRFSTFFICPTFNESAVEREVNAVNSEHEKNIQVDSWRLAQLEQSTCNPSHDYNRFGTGSLETLMNNPKSKGINIRDELIQFYEKFYSANAMSLAILGKESLEDLTKFAVEYFISIKNKNVTIQVWDDHPFGDDHLKLWGYVVPVKDIRSINLSFPIPDIRAQYKCDPGSYIAHLIGHEGPGSLLSELKRLGWAVKLMSGCRAGSRGFSFYITNIELTEDGADHIDEIVMLHFQYIAMLKKEGIQEWIFEENGRIRKISFDYKDSEQPRNYVSQLTESLFNYPFEDVLKGPFLTESYNPEQITNILDLLSPKNVRIAVINKKYKDICTDFEQWYGTQYKLQRIKEETLKMWESAPLNPNLKLPEPNEFIPSKLEILSSNENNSQSPQLLMNTPMVHLWHKQDSYYCLPKAIMSFELESPMTYVDPLHFNMNCIFVELVKESLNEYAYSALLAGLGYELHNLKVGFLVQVTGYNDKQSLFLQKILSTLTKLKIDKNRFNIIKNELKRMRNNFKSEVPYKEAIYYTSLLVSERIWSNDELLDCIDEITVEMLEAHIPRFLSNLHIEALIYGNVSKMGAIECMNVVESMLKSNMNTRPMLPSQLFKDREYTLTDGESFVYEVVNNIHNNSAVEAYYQCGVQEEREVLLLDLLVSIISEPCYSFLRTQEQLGYIVTSDARRSIGAQGLRILIQSEKSPTFVDGRIEAFIAFIEKQLSELSDEEFQNHVESLSNLRLKTPRKLAIQHIKYWSEIQSRQYHFNRDHKEVECLATITKSELFAFFKNFVASDACRRKKLSVYVIPKYMKELSITEGNDNFTYEEEIDDALIPPPPAFRPPVKIENINEFKSSLGLYPLVPPYIPIPPPDIILKPKAKL